MKKKHPVRKVLLSILVVLLVAALVIVPFALEKMKETDEDKGSLLSSQVSLASIAKTVSGAGTLTDEDPIEVKLPYGVEVTKYLVSNNDFVTEGQALAEVDRISVMNSIYNYQEDLSYVESQMALYTDSGATNFLTTTSAGRVMELYADVGDSINDVMLEHGALAVLSLDGLLAVDADCGDLAVGCTVGVQSSDGGIVPGHVESKKNGLCVITLDQYDQTVGDIVTILNTSYEPIGSGVLYVHSPLRITGYTGTIEAVHVKLGQDLYQGATLFTYSGNSNSAEYGVYSAKHTELAGYVEQLFKMYTDGTVTADCAGVISGIDEDAAAELLSASGDDTAVLDLLTNVTTLEDSGTKAAASTLSTGYPKVYYESGKVNYMVTNHDAGSNPSGSWINIVRTDRQYSDRLDAVNSVATASWPENLSFEQLNNYGVSTENINESNIGKLIFVFEYYCESPDTYRLNSIAVEVSGLTVWASTTAEKTFESKPTLENLSFTSGKPQLMLLGNDNEYCTVNGVGYSKAVITNVWLDEDNDNDKSYVEYAVDNNCYINEDAAREFYGTDNTTEFLSFSYLSPYIPVYNLDESSKGTELIFPYSVVDGVRQYPVSFISSDLSWDLPENGEEDSEEGGSYTGTGGSTGGMSGTGSMSSMSGSSSSSTEASHSYYSTKQTTIMSVTPQDSMTVDITVDELDILSIERGQEVQITLDALTGQSFDGVITDIGVSGSNSGGNTKYTAEVTIPRSANMIAGMNATALITLSSTDGLLTLPSEAIECEGTKEFVYTGYDAKTESLIDPVFITTGLSDGLLTEIRTGLEAGDTVWYNYLDTLDTGFDFSNMPMPPQMG